MTNNKSNQSTPKLAFSNIDIQNFKKVLEENKKQARLDSKIETEVLKREFNI